MKFISIARKTLREYLREPLLLGLVIFFPLMLVGLYYLAFGQTDQGLAQYLTVLVQNKDVGAHGKLLVKSLTQAEYQGQPMLNVVLVSAQPAAKITLRERKAAMLVIIPPGFSRAFPAETANSPPATVTLLGDTTSETFNFAQGMVAGVVREFVNRRINWQDPAPIIYEFLPGTGTMSDFDFGVPGTIVFGLMFLAVTTAQTMVREQVNGTLRRFRLSAAGAVDLLGGISLAQMALAVIIVPLTFGCAALLGFTGNGSLLLAMGIGLLFSPCAIGLGLLVACFARTDSEAANLSAGVGVIMVLLSGALYPMPDSPLFTLGGQPVQTYDLLPPTHAAEAMRRVLIFGEGVAAVSYHLIALAILSVLIFGLGVILFQHLQMKQ